MQTIAVYHTEAYFHFKRENQTDVIGGLIIAMIDSRKEDVGCARFERQVCQKDLDRKWSAFITK